MSWSIGYNRNLFVKLNQNLDVIMLYLQLQKFLLENLHRL